MWQAALDVQLKICKHQAQVYLWVGGWVCGGSVK